jgi:hypothetical protein
MRDANGPDGFAAAVRVATIGLIKMIRITMARSLNRERLQDTCVTRVTKNQQVLLQKVAYANL